MVVILVSLPFNTHYMSYNNQEAYGALIRVFEGMSCFVSCAGHLLLTSCPTLRAEEEEEVEEEEEAWWRGLCLWGMWSRLG